MYKRQKSLLRELDHRVRNNLSGLLGMIRLYQASATDVASIADAVRDKVLALKEVHDLASQAAGREVGLDALIQTMVNGFVPAARTAAVSAHGPAVHLEGNQAASMAMVLQELFTNSAKYGALTSPVGRIEVRWTSAQMADHQRIDILWQESGVALTARPNPPRRGVGLTLIEGLCRSDLRGGCQIRFRPTGLEAAIYAAIKPSSVGWAASRELAAA